MHAISAKSKLLKINTEFFACGVATHKPSSPPPCASLQIPQMEASMVWGGEEDALPGLGPSW